jgi:hypothetical protein
MRKIEAGDIINHQRGKKRAVNDRLDGATDFRRNGAGEKG